MRTEGLEISCTSQELYHILLELVRQEILLLNEVFRIRPSPSRELGAGVPGPGKAPCSRYFGDETSIHKSTNIPTCAHV